MTRPRLLPDRFATKYLVSPDGCWRWLAARSGGGSHGQYGIISKGNGIKEYAHRVSWMLHRGPIPGAAVVLHTCDNTLCVNPEHLKLGTPGDNVRDCAQKDRIAWGEKNGYAKLTEAAVREIRGSTESLRAAAARFGVHRDTIHKIRRGERWARLA